MNKLHTKGVKTAEQIIGIPRKGIVNESGVYITTPEWDKHTITQANSAIEENMNNAKKQQDEIDKYNEDIFNGVIDPVYKDDFNIASGLLLIRAVEMNVLDPYTRLWTPRTLPIPFASGKDGFDPHKSQQDPSPYKNIGLVVASGDAAYPQGTFVIVRPEVTRAMFDRVSNGYIVPNRFLLDITGTKQEDIKSREKGYFLIRSFDVVASTKTYKQKLNEISK